MAIYNTVFIKIDLQIYRYDFSEVYVMAEDGPQRLRCAKTKPWKKQLVSPMGFGP